MQKKLMSSYEPPRLVKGNDRWYISFYAPNDLNGNQREKFRQAFNLSKFNNLKQREARAVELIAKLNLWLEAGKPISKFDEYKVRLMVELNNEDRSLEETPVPEAFAHVLQLKERLREESTRSYKSIGGLFLKFLARNKWDRLAIGDITKMHAMAYLDDCLIRRKLAPVTWNNQVTLLTTIFNDLMDRGYIQKNPFHRIKKKKKLPKKRRNFTAKEASMVLSRIQQEDTLLFYTVLMLYCCFLRPKEIRLLRFQDVDLKHGLIRLSYQDAKDSDNRTVTIPNTFLKYFDPEFFKKYPGMKFIFGPKFIPGGNTTCGKQVAFRRHEKILHQLHREGNLHDIHGLTLYSWKDTGITDALENLPLLAVQDQAGHSSPQMTMKYRHKKLVNEPFKEGFENKLLK